MKKAIKYIPYFFFVFALLSFIAPSIYEKVGDNAVVSYNFLELTYGKDEFDFSIGLFIVFALFLAMWIFSIPTLNRNNKALDNVTIILGLSSGVLTFFQRLLSSPNSTSFSIGIGLILPGVLIILGTIFIFINKKIIKG